MPFIPFDYASHVMMKIAKEATVPVCLHFDHGTDYSKILEAMKAGFTSVMYDGSSLPYETNIANTKEISKVAHALGVSVEAELGHVGGAEGATEASMEDASKFYTDPEQARDFVDQKPRGLHEHIEQGGRNLSGGQRQRLTIARALIGSPEILILDDSASALDFATDAALRKALRELAGNPTVFIISQRTSSIRHADLILVLDEGRMVGMGKHDDLLRTCETYREIHLSQFKGGEEA